MTVGRVSIVSIVLGLRLKLLKLSYIWCPPPPPMSLPFPVFLIRDGPQQSYLSFVLSAKSQNREIVFSHTVPEAGA